MISYFLKLWRWSFRHSMFVGERVGTQFMIKLPVFMKKKCSNIFGTNRTCLLINHCAQMFPNIKRYFRNQWFFFTSGIGTDILMNMLEGWIVFLIWEAWVLIFILIKNFQSEALLKMPPSSPFMEEFGLCTQK